VSGRTAGEGAAISSEDIHEYRSLQSPSNLSCREVGGDIGSLARSNLALGVDCSHLNTDGFRLDSDAGE
jgi:hypothetical protein